MKLNANDPGVSGNYRVFLDDVELPYCIEADDEAGYAIVHVRNQHGFVMDAADNPVTERRLGRVRIEPKSTA